MIPKASRFEALPEVVLPVRSMAGASFWCRSNPHELVLDGSAEVDRLEYFQDFCSSKNEVQIVRILTFHVAMHKRQTPALAVALGCLTGLRVLHFENFSHLNAEFEVLRLVLEATQDRVEEIHISCDGEAFDAGSDAWCFALRQCRRLRFLRIACRAGILLNHLCRVPLDNAHLEEVHLSSMRLPQALHAWHVQHLTNIPALRRLRMDKFRWLDGACQVMADYCERSKLTVLELHGSQWQTEGGAALFLGCLLPANPLERLVLSDCQLATEDLQAVTGLLSNGVLQHVNVSGNRGFSDSAVRDLGEKLPESNNMRFLNVQKTDVSPRTLIYLMEQKATSNLEFLHLDRQTCIPWKTEEMERVAELLVRHAEWKDFGAHWEEASEKADWNIVDRLLYLNRSGRAAFLDGGVANLTAFLERIDHDPLATFLHLKYDAVGMGLLSST